MDYKIGLQHHGILGQRWGKRNGPPYPLGGGDYTQAERNAIYKSREPNSSMRANRLGMGRYWIRMMLYTEVSKLGLR